MKYLKEFSTENDYLVYRDGSDYLKPNVSLSDDKGSVYYNYFPPPPIVYKAVDLGLPSGTKWATQNVGARKPSDAGLYFQWGDTQGYTKDQVGTGEGKKKFASDWSDYKWYKSRSGEDVFDVEFKKYTETNEILELEDDAAHVYMGGYWHMPTSDQLSELIENTTNAWTALENVSGVTFTSKKDTSKSIFIPAAGNAIDGSLDYSRTSIVWGSDVSIMFTYDANAILYFEDTHEAYNDYYCERYLGQPVRGVIGTIS